MKKWGGAIMDYFLNPLPTLFDWCAVLGVIGMGFIKLPWQGFYFCLYSVFVVIIGFYQKCERNIVFPSLTLLSLIALAGIFSHGFLSGPGSITFQYLNFMLMFEGFGYVFFGSALFYCLVCKGRNLRMFYVTLPIALLWTIKSFLYSGRGSIIFALALAVIIFLLYNKKFYLAGIIALLAVMFFAVKHDWFIMKFACRPFIWHDMIFSDQKFPPIGLKQHPFIGFGFNQLMIPDNLMCSTLWGRTWIFKHNDYLNAFNILGIFAVIPMTMFIWKIIRQVRCSFYLIPVLTICILCFVQMTIFAGDRALAIVSFLSLAVIETERK